jgi:DNA-binding MarR family transcriptional regulator
MPSAPRRGALVLDLTTAASLAAARLGRELEALGISIELLGLLTEIRLAEPITPTTLAARTGHPLTTLSDYVQRLVDRGEVERDANPDDRRSHLLTVTPQGRERLVASSQAVAGVDRAGPRAAAVGVRGRRRRASRSGNGRLTSSTESE